MMNKSLLFGCVLLLTACAGKYQPSYIYSQVEVNNNSNETLAGVSVELTGVGRTFDCGDIGPLRNCFFGAGKRRYVDGPIEVDWAYAGGPNQSSEFVIVPPADYATGVPLRVVIDVSPEGEMTAYFRQYSVF